MRAVEAPPLVIHDNGNCCKPCSHHPLREDEIEIASAFLAERAEHAPFARMNSYDLKHAAENSTKRPGVAYEQTDRYGHTWTGSYRYVSNGAMIEAARRAGYRIRPIPGSLNVMIAVKIRRVVRAPIVQLEGVH